MIFYGLFTDHDNVLLDTWALTRSTTTDVWYDKLDKSDNLLKNLNLATGVLSDVNCLIVGKYWNIISSDAITSIRLADYSLAADACNEKHSAICKYDPQIIVSLPAPPKFPCLTKNRIERRKRSTSAENHCKKGEGQTLLINHPEVINDRISNTRNHYIQFRFVFR